MAGMIAGENYTLLTTNGSLSNHSILNHSLDFSNTSVLNYDVSGGGEGQGSSFFDTYYSTPRIIVESVLAALSLAINCLALLSSANARNKRYSIYHILFINLCVCNALSLTITWISNNSFFLFQNSFPELLGELCKMFVYLTSAVFIASSFSIVSIVTLLGFITLQYIAICRPLQHMSLVQKRRVLVFIALTWVLTLVCGCVPFFTLLYLSEECTGDVLLLIFRLSQIGANCIIVVMFLVYTLILVLCIRIFYEVRQLRKRLSQFRFDQEVQGERRAFFTTLMLIASLTLFYIPFTTVYVYSLNKDGMAIHNSALIYYMTLLPYAKFFIDPLIYGLRMKEIREGCVRFAFHCGCSKCVTMDNIALSRATSVTSTMRMRSFSQKNGQKMQRYVFTSAQGGSVAMT